MSEHVTNLRDYARGLRVIGCHDDATLLIKAADALTAAETALAEERARREEANDAAKSYRLALALALSIPVSNITVESAQAWIDDWKARNE